MEVRAVRRLRYIAARMRELATPSGIRRALTRSRHGWATLLAVVALAGAVAAHHELPAHVHGGDDVLTCLAVVVAGVAVALPLAAAARLPRPQRSMPLPPAPAAEVVIQAAWPRAGPLIQLHSVLLRR